MKIRLEEEKDYFQVENLTREAFWNVYRPGCEEHLILHKLRNAGSFIKELDYVAVEDDKIVGNIVYSKMFRGDEKTISKDVICFGPISVMPKYQSRGIGKKLIEFTCSKAEKLGYKAVLITGNNNYYNKLGFVSASKYGVYMPGMAQDEEAVFFMAKNLEEGYLEKHPGIYDFDSCFITDRMELDVFDKKFEHKRKREAREGDL